MLTLILPHIAKLATVAVLCAVIVKCIVYPIFLSPLSKLPVAHPLAYVTSLWIQWHRWRGTEFDCVTQAFANQGSYVRLAPNEIAVNEIEAVRSVYGIGKNNFDKDPYYGHFGSHGVRNTFTSLGMDHRARRRRISAIYSRSFVRTSPHVRAILHCLLVDRMLPIFAQASSSSDKSLNVPSLFHAFALDFVSLLAFGISRGTNFIDNDQMRWGWMEQLRLAYPDDKAFWMREHSFLVNILGRIGIPILPKAHFQAVKEREDWALAKVSECEDAMHDSKGKIRDIASLPLGELPIIYAYMRSAMEKTAPVDGHFTLSSHQALEVASEILDHITATGDTFGTMFTYMVYELSRRQDIQKDLCEELLGIANPFLYNGITESSMPILADLEGLPCLESVIKESLRLRTQTPNLAPRVTPPNRRSSVGFLCNLPPGIRIGTYGWWLNRNPDVFPDPDTWEPRRWLGGGPDAAALRDKWLFAFGGGSRGCIGEQIAMDLLRLLISGIYSNFKTTVLDEAEYPGANKFHSSFCEDKLFIKFERLPRSAAEP